MDLDPRSNPFSDPSISTIHVISNDIDIDRLLSFYRKTHSDNDKGSTLYQFGAILL